MRTIAIAGSIILFLAASPSRAQNACDALLNGMVTAHGVASDVAYKESPTVTQFFIRQTDLPCRSDIMVMVKGRLKCSDGKRATVQGRFDIGDLGGQSTYLLITDSDHAACQ